LHLGRYPVHCVYCEMKGQNQTTHEAQAYIVVLLCTSR